MTRLVRGPQMNLIATGIVMRVNALLCLGT